MCGPIRPFEQLQRNGEKSSRRGSKRRERGAVGGGSQPRRAGDARAHGAPASRMPANAGGGRRLPRERAAASAAPWPNLRTPEGRSELSLLRHIRHLRFCWVSCQEV